MGAHRTRSRKAVRFSLEVEEIAAEWPDSEYAPLSATEEQRNPGSSRVAATGNHNIVGSVRPSSPPMRNRDIQVPDLTGHITREHKFPSAHGGFADVWMGVWHKESAKVKVGGQS